MNALPEKMDEGKLVDIISGEFKNAMGRPDGDISKIRRLAWNRYSRELLGNEVDDESQVVTSDVAEVVDGLMPGLMRIFALADNLCMFRPVSEEDVPKAEQETEYVNHVFWKGQENSFMEMFFWIFDTLYGKNGIAIAWLDESEHITEEEHTGLTVQKIDEIIEGTEDGVTMEAVSRSEPYQKTVPVGDGQAKIEVFDVTFRRLEKRREPRWETVPPDEFRISNDANRPYTSCARFRGRERFVPRSHLVEFGFDLDQVYSIEAAKVGASVSNTEKQNKQKTSDERSGDRKGGSDKSQELVLWQEAYINIDFDGDGRSELRQVFLAGGKLLKWAGGEPANQIVHRDPFHTLVAKPLPHTFWAKAPAEDEIDTQEVTSTLLRQTLMNAYHTNNPGHGVDESGLSENTMSDLLTSKVGRVARFNGNPNEIHKSLAVPFTANHTFDMIGYFDQKKKDRHGVHSDSEGLSADSLKNIQKGVLANMLDISTQKQELIARVMGEGGIKSLLLHLHELLLRHPNEQRVFRLRNEFVPIDPSEWRHRYDMDVNIGLGIGNREQQQMFLEAIAEKQEAILQSEGANLIVKPKHYYNTLVALAKNAKIADPSLHFEDPKDQLAPPPSSEQEELQRQQQALQAQQQKIDEQREANDRISHQLDMREQNLRHEREMAKLSQENEKRLDRYAIDNDKLRNDIAKLQLQAIDEEEKRELARAKAPAEIEEIKARAAESRARAMKTLEEARGQDIENAQTESGLTDLVNEIAGSEEDTESDS